MLGMKTYEKEYVGACRAKIDADVRAFKKSGSKELETTFFNNMVLKLEYMFVHRLTGIEGKDGNPLNEVRVLCNSMLLNQGKLQVDRLPGWPNSAGSGIKLPPDKSVLKLRAGDAVQVSEDGFVRLAKAFFAEIEKRYS
ncbi:MAG: hypothetical protein E6K08_09155 [Methanobacteriota archaeon]|nr:MAG: hypothetical protein E6K08_09155 [Euryarchaeota archaeon]